MKMKRIFCGCILGCVLALTMSIGVKAETVYEANQEGKIYNASSETDFSITSSGEITNYKGTDTVVVIPNTINGYPVVKIRAEVFRGKNITEVIIPEGVTTIEEGVFYLCKSLEKVTLPSTITSIGSKYTTETGVFQECESLVNVTIADGANDAYIGAKTFFGCKNLKTITIPGNYMSIGEKAFVGCERLTSVIYKENTITKSLQKVEVSAFEGCEKLKNVLLSTSLDTIGARAFRGCISIQTLNIPEGVKNIEYGAFKDCKSLITVSLPSTITKLGGTNVNYLEDGVFENCISLSNLSFEEGTEEAYIGQKSFKECDKLTKVQIPNNYIEIYEEAFYGCDSLIDVTLGESISRIRGKAFAYDTAIMSIMIPEGAKRIDKEAFISCTGLINVNLPSTLVILGDSVFKDCIILKTVSMSRGTEKATIGNYAFQNSGIVSIKIPGNYKKIYSYAFDSCINLEKVLFEKESILEEISIYAFQNCTKLDNLVIPENVMSIGIGAFTNCTALKSVSLPSTIEELGGKEESDVGVFESCVNLDNVVWRKGGEMDAYIGNRSFYGCISLKEIIIPGNVEEIYRRAFGSCDMLEKVVLEKGIYVFANQIIHLTAFNYCTSLKEVYIPSTVASIDHYAFNQCKDFTIYGVTGTEAETFVNYFTDNPSNITSNITFAEYNDDLSFSMDCDANVLEGTSIKLTAAGGSTYQFRVYNPETDSDEVIKNYSPSNVCQWKSNGSGKRIIYVDIKSETGLVTTLSLGIYIEKVLSVTASASKTSAEVGEEITFSAVAESGLESYTYKFALFNVNTGVWTVLKDFSSDSSLVYNFKKAGNYQFAVTVKDSDGKTAAAQRVDINVKDNEKKLSAVLKANGSMGKLIMKKGEKLNLNVEATGGSGNYTYKFAVLNVDTGKWSVLKDFSSIYAYTYALNYPGTKQFAVTVKDSVGNTVATERITVVVENTSNQLKASLKTNGSTDNVTVSKGTKMTLEVSASGGSGSYTYKFAVLNVDTGKWSILKDFSESSVYTYALNYPGKKQFAVTVKDSTGKTVATNRLTVVVNN